MIDPSAAAAVRHGLVRMVADPEWWPTAHPEAFRNRLLDEGGGDSRPHVELAWRLHEMRVAERLAQHDGDPLHRCRAVARDLAAASLLDRDAVRWGVTSWALALGVIDAATVAAGEAPPAVAAAPIGRAGAAAALSPGVAATPRASTVPAAAPVAPARRRWTIGAPGTPRSPLPRGPSASSVVALLAGITAFFGVLVIGGRLLRPDVASVAPPGPARDAAASVARDTFQSVARDTGPVFANGPAAPATPRDVPNIPRGIPGEVRLRDGRRLAGIIDLVTASDVYLHDTTTNLPMAMPLAFVADVRTADGRVAWRAPADDETSTMPPSAVALRDRGVGGTYRVLVRSATVDGDEACRDGWDRGVTALTEHIAHVPGSTTAALDSRRGVTLALDADGRFVAGPVTGVDGATRWQFAMRGQFAPEGFTASSDLLTRTTLKWRKVRQCRIRADLAGIRRR